MRASICLCLILTAPAAAQEAAAPERSPLTMNSGIPLSETQRSFTIEHYEIRNEIFPAEKSITGSAQIHFKAVTAVTTLELDFDGQLLIDSIADDIGPLVYERDQSKLYIALRDVITADREHRVRVSYRGAPHEAENPPWSGGFQWATTPAGEPWVATAIQGEGCDLWWPCVDHPQREPKAVDLYFTVAAGLTAVANGVLMNTEDHPDGRRTFHWRTESATNTYGIALNVAPYVLLEQRYTSTNGTEVPVKFWVLEEHRQQGQALMDRDFLRAIEFFERKLGPYPWGHEKLGVVETPHLGMEHQTINAYGNQFRRTRHGFDALFHHELAHEWFGNLMTHATVSDMWLHEGPGTYMQPLYAREVLGEAAYYDSMYRSYLQILGCNPLAPRAELTTDEVYFDSADAVGPAGDIYSKGAWVLESMRYLLGDEAFWRAIRILLYDTATPAELKPPITARIRSTDDFLKIASDVYGADLSWFFEVYVRRGPLPELVVAESDSGVTLRWQTPDDLGFPMPVPVRIGDQLHRVDFADNQARLEGVALADIQIDPAMRILRQLPILPTCTERRAEAAAASD